MTRMTIRPLLMGACLLATFAAAATTANSPDDHGNGAMFGFDTSGATARRI